MGENVSKQMADQTRSTVLDVIDRIDKTPIPREEVQIMSQPITLDSSLECRSTINTDKHKIDDSINKAIKSISEKTDGFLSLGVVTDSIKHEIDESLGITVNDPYALLLIPKGSIDVTDDVKKMNDSYAKKMNDSYASKEISHKRVSILCRKPYWTNDGDVRCCSKLENHLGRCE